MVLVVWATMYIAAGAQGPRPAKAPTKTSSHHTQAAHPHGKHAAKERAEPFVNQGPMAPAPEVAATNVGAQAAADATPPGEPVSVTYEQGALAITTHDAPLRDVLNKVGETTGAVVETPALEQSVTVNVPAQAPVQAIAALLDGQGKAIRCGGLLFRCAAVRCAEGRRWRRWWVQADFSNALRE